MKTPEPALRPLDRDWVNSGPGGLLLRKNAEQRLGTSHVVSFQREGGLLLHSNLGRLQASFAAQMCIVGVYGFSTPLDS